MNSNAKRRTSKAAGAVMVLVTRHAVRRYAERARVATPTGQVESELRQHVLEGIAGGKLLSAGGGTHIMPFRAGRSTWLCLVLRLALHPAGLRAIACTVLTQAMAVQTFGHVIGLISMMSEPRPRAAA